MAPASTIRTAIAEAKIGRWMKKLTIGRSAPARLSRCATSGLRGVAAAKRTRAPARSSGWAIRAAVVVTFQHALRPRGVDVVGGHHGLNQRIGQEIVKRRGEESDMSGAFPPKAPGEALAPDH